MRDHAPWRGVRRAEPARRIVVMALLALLALSATVPRAAASSLATVTALDAHGKRLPRHPVLERGETVRVVATGFAPGARVQVAVRKDSVLTTVTAGGSGSVQFSYTVPARAPYGRYHLLFAGRAAHNPRAPALGVGRRTANRDPQVIRVSVPLVDDWLFRVGRRDGRGVGGHTGNHGGRDPGGSEGQTASTGFDILEYASIAAFLIVLGATISEAGRRRRYLA